MQQIFSGEFWDKIDSQTNKAGIAWLLLVLSWVIVTLGLFFFTGAATFAIKTGLQFKIFFAVIVFLGRYYLLPQHRDRRYRFWWFGGALLMMVGLEGNLAAKGSGQLLLTLVGRGFDAVIWAVFIALFLETLGGLFRFWFTVKWSWLAELTALWAKFEHEMAALGIFLTLLAGLVFYYLMSLFIFDAFMYSYVLVGLVVLISGTLFSGLILKLTAGPGRRWP